MTRRLLATVIALAVPATAQASVTYQFTSTGDVYSVTGGFRFKTSDFLNPTPNAIGGIEVSPDRLDSCSANVTGLGDNFPDGPLPCARQDFVRANNFTASGISYDIIGFGIMFPAGASLSYFYFQDGAFAKVGHYASILPGAQIAGYLDVTQAVPEPLSWLMMIAGFGIVGLCLRLRRSGAGRHIVSASRRLLRA